jgi:transglutaminase-like putative cysteine protease
LRLWRPLPRPLARAFSILILLAWAGSLAALLRESYSRASPVALAADLARYGSAAQWKGIYYRGEKIGFVVTQTVPLDDGFELQEDGELQMSLLGAVSAARLRTSARVDAAFALRSFSFSLDPGSGPIGVEGKLDGARLTLEIRTPAGVRSEVRELPQPPLLALNLSRRLAVEGLSAGRRLETLVFDPATLSNQPMQVEVGERELVRAAGWPVPAFRVTTRFSGVTSTSWVTDLGEVVKEESPLGLLVVKETRERALARAVPGSVQADLLEAAAVVPQTKVRIDDPASVLRLKLRLQGAELSGADLQGAGQTVDGDVFEIHSQRDAKPGAADADAGRFLGAEPLVESDDPEIQAEARRAVSGLGEGPRARAERLVRHVNALLEKKPTVSLPSAREVLRTRVGDCNEHTALYVGLARALGIPARVAVGLVCLHGAFYYHAWPEVYLAESDGRGLWLPVDPTLNQFPADATHLRLTRGGLERQASILPLIGRLEISVLDIELRPGSVPILVGRAAQDMRPPSIALPRRQAGPGSCWARPER